MNPAAESETKLPESKRSARLGWGILLVGVALLVVLGGAWAGDYGMSWDVARTARLGSLTLRSYLTLKAPPEVGTLADMDRHGPAAAALTEALTGMLESVWPQRTEYQVRYFVSFLWFALGMVCFYGLARRWVNPAGALATSALLATQPLLFGHGFINPSDGPFLTLFAAAMLVGFWFADALNGAIPSRAKSANRRPGWRDLKADWTNSRIARRRTLLLLSAVFVALAAELLFVHRVFLPGLAGAVRAAYEGTAWPPINGLFRFVAEDATRAPLGAYFDRLWLYYSRWRWLILGGLGILVVTLWVRVLPKFSSGIRIPKPYGWAVLAGAVLGTASAVRLIAPLAGLLVMVVVLARAKHRGLGPIVVYWGTAAVVCYLAWPSLWLSPIGTFWAFLTETALVPFDILVLFDGQRMLAEDLPWHYLPSLLILQITLPALVLGGFGAVLSLRSDSPRRIEILVTALWLLLPVGIAVALRSTLYDNGRHYLFVWPAFFLFAALAFERAWAWRRSAAFRVALCTAVLLPGVLAILRLHPYEYIYFNELAGGVRGAFRRYELDYWATSYRETMAYINREAPAGAVVAVGVARELFDDYARADLRLAPEVISQGDIPDIDFAMTSTRADHDLRFFPEAPIVFRVEVDGAVLAIVRDLR